MDLYPKILKAVIYQKRIGGGGNDTKTKPKKNPQQNR